MVYHHKVKSVRTIFNYAINFNFLILYLIRVYNTDRNNNSHASKKNLVCHSLDGVTKTLHEKIKMPNRLLIFNNRFINDLKEIIFLLHFDRIQENF